MPDLAKKSAFPKYFLIFTATVVTIGVLSYGGLRVYRKWEPTRLAHRARVYWEKGDSAKAMLTLRQAMNINGNNVASIRLVAEIAESRGDTGAIGWRNRLVDLQPGTPAAVLECAETALRMGQPPVAGQVLGKMPERDRNSPRYHEVFAKTALALNRPDLAVEHYEKALGLDANNDSYKLNYSAALLERGLLDDRAKARASLEALAAKPGLSVPALRALVKDSSANRDLDTAIELARKLTGKPDATFADRMTLLNLLRRKGSPELATDLAALKTSARGNIAQVAELLVWMNGNDRAREGIEWSDEFTSSEWADSKVGAVVAACALTLRDWWRLGVLTKIGPWGNLRQDLLETISICTMRAPRLRAPRKAQNWGSLEYLRCALLARSLREQGRDGEASQQWAAAVTAVAGQREAAAALAHLAADWGWEVELEPLLHDALNNPKESDWAAHILLNRLVQKRDTQGLWEIMRRAMDANPGNDAVTNNFVMFSLLLGRELPRAANLARKLYDAHPREAKYVSTYAFSLHVLNHADETTPLMRSLAPEQEAVKIMRTLSPDQLETPDVAAYYGILLASIGDREQAIKFLDLAKGGSFLPEEAALINQARRRVE